MVTERITPMAPPTTTRYRLDSLDALRGTVMILMALDHVRDFFHSGARSFSPTDLARTTPALFLTRWITHFCLPVFVFAAGMGAQLFAQNYSIDRLTRFLWTRGIWFIFLELTVMQFAYNFAVSSHFLILLLVLWIFGICMLALAALIHLPKVCLVSLSVAVILFHNCLDGIQKGQSGFGGILWHVFHQPGVISVDGRLVLVTYTLVPWIALMAAGYCFGPVFVLEAQRRRKILLNAGLGLTIAFVGIRAVNLYGDPSPWVQQKSAVFTVLSFLNCTKYPASLDFLLMTLGPSLLFLAYLDGRSFRRWNPLIVFGRVPMFYFVLHFYLIHLLAVLFAFLRYGGKAARFIFGPLPSMGGIAQAFPPHFGYGLSAVYGLWVLTVALMYPLCRWFVRVKATRRDWWLSYL